MAKEVIVRSYEAERDRRVLRLSLAITLFLVGFVVIWMSFIWGVILMLPIARWFYNRRKIKTLKQKLSK